MEKKKDDEITMLAVRSGRRNQEMKMRRRDKQIIQPVNRKMPSTSSTFPIIQVIFEMILDKASLAPDVQTVNCRVVNRLMRCARRPPKKPERFESKKSGG